MLQVVNLMHKEPCGPERVAGTTSRRFDLPCWHWGITLDNAKPILEGGACGVAVISAIAMQRIL